MPELQTGAMVKQPPVKISVEGIQSTMQSPSVENERLPEPNPEEIPPSKIKKLVRKLTKKVKPPKEKEASLPAEQESAEDKLAGFMNRNPKLYEPAKEEPKPNSLEIPAPMVRERTLSRRQRFLERLEEPLILDPTPEKEVEEQEKAKETMRQSRAARYRERLEEYL